MVGDSVNCNLSDEDRARGKRCRSFKCRACPDYFNSKETPPGEVIRCKYSFGQEVMYNDEVRTICGIITYKDSEIRYMLNGGQKVLEGELNKGPTSKKMLAFRYRGGKAVIFAEEGFAHDLSSDKETIYGFGDYFKRCPELDQEITC